MYRVWSPDQSKNKFSYFLSFLCNFFFLRLYILFSFLATFLNPNRSVRIKSIDPYGRWWSELMDGVGGDLKSLRLKGKICEPVNVW